LTLSIIVKIILSTCFTILVSNLFINSLTLSTVQGYANEVIPTKKSTTVNNQVRQDGSVLSGSTPLRLGCICHLENDSFSCVPSCMRDSPIPTSLESENIRADNMTKLSPNFQTNISKFVYPAEYDNNKIYFKKEITPIPKDKLYVVGETSVASNGTHVLYVGNRYTTRSLDNGTTWEFIDPKSLNFRTFCCDQRVIYNPHYKLFIWLLQEHPIPRDAHRNIDRIAVSKDLTDWAIYDIAPYFLNWRVLGKHAFDFPELATGNNHLYVTSNVNNFNAGTGSGKLGSVILRFSLDNLSKITSQKDLSEARNKAGVQNLFPAFNITYYLDRNARTITPVQGSSDQMFFATHINTTTMRIYQWNESQENVIVHDRIIDGWNELSTEQCNKQTEHSKLERQVVWWCGNIDSRISSGWMYDGIIGFLWTANRTVSNNLGQLSMPYINSAIFDINKNISYIGRSYIASPLYPWLYGSAAVNDRGDLGLIAFYGDNNISNINVAFGVNNYKADSDWKLMSLVNSTGKLPVYNPECEEKNKTDDCNEYKWGDFITIRPHYGSNRSLWDISAYVLNGTKASDVVPFYFIASK
jgi:hypothetical protein